MAIIVVHTSEVERCGCPKCGCTRAHILTDWGDEAQHRVCVLCLTTYIRLSDQLQRSRLTTTTAGESTDPEVKPHPRRGIPGHDPGLRPEQGEFCYPLGVEQFEAITSCFVCGQTKCLGKILVGQVLDLEAQSRVSTLYPPAYPQRGGLRIKIDACMTHMNQIHQLFQQLRSTGILSQELLALVKTSQ